MADRIEWFEFTIPANTPQSAPVSFPMKFNFGTVVEIDVKVPPGPAGNMGFFISAGGSQFIPRTFGSFIFPDSDYLTWPVANAINSGSWGLTAFNTDVWAHTIQVAFQINEVQGSPELAFGAPIGL